MFWVSIRFLFYELKKYEGVSSNRRTHSDTQFSKADDEFCFHILPLSSKNGYMCLIKQRLKTYVTFLLRLFGEDVASAAERKEEHRTSFTHSLRHSSTRLNLRLSLLSGAFGPVQVGLTRVVTGVLKSTTESENKQIIYIYSLYLKSKHYRYYLF